MEIKREVELTVRSSRRFIVRRSSSVGSEVSCEQCGEPMVVVEEAAMMFGLTQRRVFQLVEGGTVHFAETDAGATLVCVASMTGESDANAISLATGEKV